MKNIGDFNNTYLRPVQLAEFDLYFQILFSGQILLELGSIYKSCFHIKTS
jgi:hypothetical protein